MYFLKTKWFLTLLMGYKRSYGGGGRNTLNLVGFATFLSSFNIFGYLLWVM